MRLVVAVLLVTGLLGACGGDDTVPVPRGVTFQLEQTRQDLQGRKFSVQVVNDGREDMTVERVELESGRLDEPADLRRTDHRLRGHDRQPDDDDAASSLWRRYRRHGPDHATRSATARR